MLLASIWESATLISVNYLLYVDQKVVWHLCVEKIKTAVHCKKEFGNKQTNKKIQCYLHVQVLFICQLNVFIAFSKMLLRLYIPFSM